MGTTKKLELKALYIEDVRVRPIHYNVPFNFGGIAFTVQCTQGLSRDNVKCGLKTIPNIDTGSFNQIGIHTTSVVIYDRMFVIYNCTR